MKRSTLIIFGVAVCLGLAAVPRHVVLADDGAPATLAETGLLAPGSSTEIADGVLPFSPQYPLWSDGAAKRRWIRLPPGTSIDASDPDAWVFPVGTKLWKEFSVGRRVETRMIERLADGSWRFVAYVFDAGGREAALAPAEGVTLPVDGAPNGRYAVPSRYDCLACHDGGASPVLGFSALQLSPDRDPLAPHAETPPAGAVDLSALVERGLLVGLPRTLLDQPPRIAASSAEERAALGYLHGNCGHCHAAPGASGAAVPVDARMAQRAGEADSAARVRASLVDVSSRYRPADATTEPVLVSPGHPERSVLRLRMASRDPRVQMPPLGTAAPDSKALSLIERWIENLPITYPLKETRR